MGVYLRVPVFRLIVEAATPDWVAVTRLISSNMSSMASVSSSVSLALTIWPRPLMAACHMSSTADGLLVAGVGQVVVPEVSRAMVVAVCGKVP